jgi:murein DD-endopeptidase MepM/ murein hydrolase activator NlpD
MKKKKICSVIFILLVLLSFLLLSFHYKTPFVWPLKGDVVTRFMQKYYDAVSEKTRIHTGIDIKGSNGAHVCASANGTVTYIGISPIGGRTVVIKHNENIKSNYLNLADIFVKKGQYVRQGTPIATIGASDDPSGGCVHLHFAIVYKRTYLDPEDVLKIDYSSISPYIRLDHMPIDFYIR